MELRAELPSRSRQGSGSAAGHPFDTVKVRRQSEGTGRPASAVRSTQAANAAEGGLRGLYKGMAAPLAITGVLNSVPSACSSTWCSRGSWRQSPQQAPHPRSCSGRHGPQTMQGAGPSGAFISLIATPMEGVKARLQVQYSAEGAKYKALGSRTLATPLKLGVRNGSPGLVPVCLSRMSNYAYFGSYAFISRERRDLGS